MLIIYDTEDEKKDVLANATEVHRCLANRAVDDETTNTLIAFEYLQNKLHMGLVKA